MIKETLQVNSTERLLLEIGIVYRANTVPSSKLRNVTYIRRRSNRIVFAGQVDNFHRNDDGCCRRQQDNIAKSLRQFFRRIFPTER